MQYVGKVGGYVYNQWNSLNPATLSGAIDIIVIEQPDGSLHCSPWHIRFGKFQIIKPLQKKIDVYVNGRKTDLPMKLGEGGEAVFVFEIDKDSGAELLSQLVLTSPVISAASSPPGSPPDSPRLSSSNTMSPLPSNSITGSALNLNTANEPDTLQLDDDPSSIEAKIKLSTSSPSTPMGPKSPRANALKIAFEKARKITQKLNIPSKIDINGDMVLDMDGYKPNSQKNIDNSDELFNKIFIEEMENLQSGDVSTGPKFDESQWNKIISKDENGNIRIIAGDSIDDEESEEKVRNGEVDDEEEEEEDPQHSSDLESYSDLETNIDPTTDSSKTYFKTLRLTSEQLQKMKLHYGENQVVFKLHEGTSQTTANLYLWKSITPIVISDIDGTITKSDALGHVLNLIGRDWTHPGVAKLFLDIKANGYNIMYLTARSVGLAEGTRQYLKNIDQEGHKLPPGPVILSPDRTMAALRREVILKKPEVFKMSCLSDIKNLYLNLFELNTDNNKHTQGDPALNDDDRTPFYAGFGNKITDAISYRSVGIPSHRIFTINPDGEVHMELLELAGVKSSYLHIGELIDHFFPPLKAVPDAYWNDNQFNEYMINKNDEEGADGFDPNVLPGSPDYDEAKSINSGGEEYFQYPNAKSNRGGYNSVLGLKTDERYNDVNYWRDPLPNLSDLSDEEDGKDDTKKAAGSPTPVTTTEPKSPSVFSIRSFTMSNDDKSKPGTNVGVDQLSLSQQIKQQIELSEESENNKEKSPPRSTFSSPLKSFMMGGSNKSSPLVSVTGEEKNPQSNKNPSKYVTPNESMISKEEDDYTDEEDGGDEYEEEDDYSTEEDYDEDYDDEDEDEDEEDEDDYEDLYGEGDEGQDEEDVDEDEDIDQEDLDHDLDAGLDGTTLQASSERSEPSSPINLLQHGSPMSSKKSNASLGLTLEDDPKFIKASQLMKDLDLNK